MVGSETVFGTPSWVGFLKVDGLVVWSTTIQTVPSPEPTSSSSYFIANNAVTPPKKYSQL